MLEKLALIRNASELTRYATERNRTIGENIANADTPGFRAKDLEPFSVDTQSPANMRTTRAGHVTPPDRTGASSMARVHADGDSVSANGNSVSLEDQMLRAADAQRQHALATSVYRKAIDILRLSISSN